MRQHTPTWAGPATVAVPMVSDLPPGNDLSEAANESFYSHFGEGLFVWVCVSLCEYYIIFVKDFYFLVVPKIDLAFFFLNHCSTSEFL